MIAKRSIERPDFGYVRVIGHVRLNYSVNSACPGLCMIFLRLETLWRLLGEIYPEIKRDVVSCLYESVDM